ncbi:MAG TPA: DUF5710 domain-containing protein [Aromatoleum sp.]|uniref:DUF5710 domain-containing protein n=1 Tax=Aromatoleum sp. TaxID=2307007 RepID=UPI002B48780F|nr:DUF5710 domain-containing protein [Aromatoleum sp.]HJV24056.1 DUF5710 domain-containing protein [Aromatoleum sp.]
MRFNLKVPFAEKDQAKKLGARWDAGRKIWYVEGKDDVSAFSTWSPTPHDAATAVPPKQQTQQSKTYVGSEYVEQPRVCDCPPWEECDKCRPLALSSRA